MIRKLNAAFPKEFPSASRRVGVALRQPRTARAVGFFWPVSPAIGFNGNALTEKRNDP